MQRVRVQKSQRLVIRNNRKSDQEKCFCECRKCVISNGQDLSKNKVKRIGEAINNQHFFEHDFVLRI